MVLLKTSIAVGAIAFLATTFQDVLFPHGIALPMSKANGNQATFSPVDYDNESLLQPGT